MRAHPIPATRAGPTLVAGIDSSTQSCKVVVRDATSGELVREGRAAHPEGTSVDPELWWSALRQAVQRAGGLEDVAAVSVGGQQHGLVALDADGKVVRRALLWNDTRSADAAANLVAELGRQAWAEAVGSVPVASFTVTKLRWLAEHEPANAARVAAVALPHDWLSWRIAGHGPGGDLAALVTDRSEASGTGYWSAASGTYRRDLLVAGLGHDVLLPRVLAPDEQVTAGPAAPWPHLVLGAGAGDNAAAALGLGMRPGDVAISIGTSGVVSAVSETSTADPTGLVSGFADATGAFLPLACTLNAARVLDATARTLGVDLDRLSAMAHACPLGADGLTLVPYLEGERTPDLPAATGALHGIRLATLTGEHLARAAVEGVLNGLADGLEALRATGVHPRRVLLVGGGARSQALRETAPAVFGVPVDAPAPGEYVADGAARQAAWALTGRLPEWPTTILHSYAASPADRTAGADLRARYAHARTLYLERR